MKFPYLVVLDNIRSALNVGAIFRTCDAAGASKLYLCGITPYPPHNRIPKTALGATESVAWEHHASTVSLCQELKGQGYQLAAVEQTAGSRLYNAVSYSPKLALIFGNEITGVSREVLDLVDVTVELPMYGEKNSLNVATTVGIITYYIADYFTTKTSRYPAA